MISAWTRRFLLGCCLAAPIACVVSVGEDDDIDDGLPGGAGGTSRAGSGGSSGSSGTGNTAGSAGSMSIVGNGGEGNGGEGNGGEGGSDSIDTPVCTAETGDDECLTCIKQQCCTEWQACNTTTCQEQREDIIVCVDGMGDAELYNDVCIPMAAAPEDFLAENTQALMNCMNEIVTEADAGIESTRCGVACFGEDIFMD
jgi:hypothetical protein